MQAGVPQCSPVLAIFIAMYTMKSIKWVEDNEYQVNGDSSMEHVGWLAIKCNVN